MTKRQAEQSEKQWSPRSRASLHREDELLQQRATIETQVIYARKKTDELEKIQQSYRHALANGRSDLLDLMDKNRLECERFDARLRSLSEYAAEIDAKVAAERAPISGRAEIQAQFAALAETRLKSDGAIEEIIGRLRSALAERAETTRRMNEVAATIEFSGDLDDRRFAELAGSLPSSVLAESRRRTNVLLGIVADDFVPAVARMRLELPESIRHAGIFEAGENLLLSPLEFDQLNCTDAHDEKSPQSFGIRPQQVCSLKQFQNDSTAAEEAECTVADVWRQQDAQRQAEAEKRWLEEERERRLENLAIQISQRTIPAMEIGAARDLAKKKMEYAAQTF